MQDIVISDENIESISKQIKSECENLEEIYDTYICILQQVKEYAVMEGSTSDAIGQFIETAQMLKGKFEELGLQLELGCLNYIYNIDKADGELYN